MSNARLPSKQELLKELKQQIDSKPSKLEQYKQKLNEREMYEKDNLFDYFGRAGGGAPLRNEDGRVKTTRRTMLNDNYEELTMNNQNNEFNNNYNNYYNTLQEQYKQQIQQQMMNNNYNGQNQIPQMNNMNNMNSQMMPPQQQIQPPPMMAPQMNMYQEPNFNYQQSNLYNTQRNLTPYQQIQQYNQMNNGNNMMNNPSYLEQEMNNTNYHIQNSINNISNNNNYRNVQSARTPYVNNPNFNNNNVNNDINFNEVKIIPVEHQKNVDKLEVQKKMLRDDWIRQMEDKKQRLKEEKQKQIEKDRIEEMKFQKYLEEQKEAEKAQKNQNQQMNNNNQSPMSPQSNSLSNMQQQSRTPISISNKPNYSNNDNQSNSGLNQSFGILRNNSANNLNTNILNIQPPMLNYATISKNLDDTINDQIAKLRNDVSLQYVEMSNLFNKLKMDVAEANQLKGEAERELKYIRDELLKTKMNNILYENKLNQVLERNAPYNNLHIPFNEVDPFNGAHNRIQSGKNLQSTSSMVFANDMVNEGNINRVRELSSLAQVGQSLVGESEFIPIQTTNEDVSSNNNNNINVKNSNELNNSNENSTKILDDYMKKGDYQDMYKKLVDIANINHQMNPEAKVRTIGKNLEVDYDAINSKQGQKEEIKKLDDMLKDIVEKSNKYS